MWKSFVKDCFSFLPIALGILLNFRGNLNNKKMLKISCLKALESLTGGVTKISKCVLNNMKLVPL